MSECTHGAATPRWSRAAGRGWRYRTAVLLSATALVAAPATSAAWAQGTASDWSTPAGTLQGTRYSTLAEITPANVGSLVEEFAFSTGVKASHQGAPLVIGTTMYVVTPFPNHLFALDLTQPGAVKWEYSPGVDPYAHGVACCDTVNRGAAYGAGKIVFNTLDDTTVAVDATTGKQVWRTSLGNPRTGQTLTMSPLVVGNVVIVGNAGGEMGVRGWVAGLDLATGRKLWQAYGTGPDADVKIGPAFHAYYAKDQALTSARPPGRARCGSRAARRAGPGSPTTRR